GLPTNLGALRAILCHADVELGDARTTLLGEHPEMMNEAAVASPSIALFEQAIAKSPSASPGPRSGFGTSRRFAGEESAATLEMREGEIAVECPLAGSVVSVAVKEGDAVRAGDTVLVVSAMKMETAVTSPVSGTASRVADLVAGDAVVEGQIVAAIAPGEVAG